MWHHCWNRWEITVVVIGDHEEPPSRMHHWCSMDTSNVCCACGCWWNGLVGAENQAKAWVHFKTWTDQASLLADSNNLEATGFGAGSHGQLSQTLWCCFPWPWWEHEVVWGYINGAKEWTHFKVEWFHCWNWWWVTVVVTGDHEKLSRMFCFCCSKDMSNVHCTLLMDGMGWLRLNQAKEWTHFKMGWLMSFIAKTSQRPLFLWLETMESHPKCFVVVLWTSAKCVVHADMGGTSFLGLNEENEVTSLLKLLVRMGHCCCDLRPQRTIQSALMSTHAHDQCVLFAWTRAEWVSCG